MQYDENLLKNVFKVLHRSKIYSVMVEGGSQLLQSIIDQKLWDEANIEIADVTLGNGIRAPKIQGAVIGKSIYYNALQVQMKI